MDMGGLERCRGSNLRVGWRGPRQQGNRPLSHVGCGAAALCGRVRVREFAQERADRDGRERGRGREGERGGVVRGEVGGGRGRDAETVLRALYGGYARVRAHEGSLPVPAGCIHVM